MTTFVHSIVLKALNNHKSHRTINQYSYNKAIKGKFNNLFKKAQEMEAVHGETNGILTND